MCSHLPLETHCLTVGELAQHEHGQNINGNGGDAWNGKYGQMVTQGGENGTVQGYSAYVEGYHWVTKQNRVFTDSSGGNAYHNNITASIAVYIWKRTA